MIDEEETFKQYGYHSVNLFPASSLPIWAICEKCESGREVRKYAYHHLCKKCSRNEKRLKGAEELIGNKFGMLYVIKIANKETSGPYSYVCKCDCGIEKVIPGRRLRNGNVRSCGCLKNGTLSKKYHNEAKQMIGMRFNRWTVLEMHRTDKRRYQYLCKCDCGTEKMVSGCNLKNGTSKSCGCLKRETSTSENTRRRHSATLQGIAYDEWEGYASESQYCPLFDEACRESNRDKYGRRCFLTGLPESENVAKNGKSRKLSVHHVDMDKQQGCNGRRWKLVPLCMWYHVPAHSELWESRITWLLQNVWNNAGYLW